MDILKDKLFWCTIVVCLGFMANAAFAQITTGSPGADVNSPTTAAASAAAAAAANQAQGQLQGQAQGQLQGQGQGQLQGNVGLGAGNTTSTPVTVNNPAQTTLQYSGQYEVRNVPAVTVPNVYPANSCGLGASLGGSVVGFGIGGGISWESQDCRKQEVARQFYASGMKADGDAVLCSIEAAKVAPTCKAMTAKMAEAAPQEERRRDVVIRTSAVQQPTNCVSDEYVARRMGATVCK